MAKRNETASDYEYQFDSEWYINNYANNIIGDKTREIWYFSLDKLKEVFSKGDIKGQQLLDVGTGPSINSIISASDHVEEIYLSDYATANRKILFEWLNCKRELDISSFQYIFPNQSSTDVAAKHNLVRNKVKAILPIDVTDVLPLGEQKGVMEFDIITTKFCLESACADVAEYKKSVKILLSMLRPGGQIVMIGLTGITWYRVGDRKFNTFPLKYSDVLQAFEEAGADVLKFEIKHGNVRPEFFNARINAFVLVAKKDELLFHRPF